MRALASLERFLERLFERPSARLFHARLQPIQIQRRVERAMETERRSSADRTLVPNRFTVRLNPIDLEPYAAMSDSLAGELADGALAFARSHRYAVLGRPRVDLLADDRVIAGDIAVVAAFDNAEHAVLGGAASPGRAEPGPAPAVVSSETLVFQAPRVVSASALLSEIRPDGSRREVQVDGSPLTIGRATDNAVVVADGRASRHHARIQARRGALVLTDLGSTNGTRVNGVPVTEVVLGQGDRIEIGRTVLLVDALPQSA